MPTAIVVGSGYAADVMFALKHVGVRIPDQMSVAGLNQTPYEDQDKLASVTSYSMPMRMIGVEAVRLLLDRIAHPDGPRRSLRIEGHFVDHGSMSRVSSDGLPG